MKRYAVLLLTILVSLVGILLIPTTRAEQAETQTPSADAKRPVQNRGVAIVDGVPTATDDSVTQDKIPVDNTSGIPGVLNARSALSAAVMTNLGGRGTQFSEATLLANWDGREDFTADHAQKVDDFSFAELEIDQMLTRSAIGEHTIANGFNENVYYYGDSVGNLWVGADLNPGSMAGSSAGAVDSVLQINIPQLVLSGSSNGVTLLNPQAGDCIDDQVVVTGIAVTPVADLGDFDAALCGVIGEVVYVSVLDTGGCSNNASNQVFRTRIFAFGFQDGVGAAAADPVGAIQILRNALHNSGGVAVDDNGSLYFHLADRNSNSNSAIFKVSENQRTVALCGGANPRVNRVVASIPSGLSGGIAITSAQGTGASPVLTSAGYRLTNYSGPSPTFGNIQAITAGPDNVIYAAVARSFVETDDIATQATEGTFTNPVGLGPTPSMIISFADASGTFDTCSSPAPGFAGAIPLGDGLSDVAVAGTTRVAGVNNFRVFALGTGPDIGASAATGLGLLSSTLKLRMQIDPTIFNGLTVDEEGTVYVISGGTPANVGTNPSPTIGEILAFPDCCTRDRRADYIDLRGNGLPNPPASGGNVGDFDSDRFDHIFWVAPIDGATGTPTGAAGLARGFLRYTNRLAPNAISAGVTLGTTVRTLGDDQSTEAEIRFDDLDPGHQVAGGDDQNTPFRGDDNDGAGNPLLVGALFGGFEFAFGGTGVAATSIWNGFFLNSNGHITFGAGDVDFTPTITEFREKAPRIAAAWADLNPAARASNLATFPVQALGFSSTKGFKIRWIGVPEFGGQDCTGLNGNTFAINLDDDGTGRDENEAQLLDPADPTGDNVDPAFDEQEGPNDLRFVLEPNTNVLIGEPERGDGTGHFHFTYGEMLLLGTAAQPVLTGYSVGGLAITNPPGMCENDLGEAARAADNSPFGVIQNQTASIKPCIVGEGTEPTLYEWFADGTSEALGPGGEVINAVADFDLRQEGNDLASSSPAQTAQPDRNRGTVSFYGVGSSPPPNPLAIAVIPNGSLQVAPGQPAIGSAAAGSPGTGPGGTRAASPTAGIINTLGGVPLNLLGTGFFPNEVTTICFGNPPPENAVPTQRPGKTVSSALTLTCDTDNNGIADSVTALTAVTPLNKNLVRGTLSPLPGFPGTGFPLACSGGIATLTLTTTFTAGDNNIFGPFTRTTVATLDLGLRAPVILSVSPTSGEGNITQTLLISGSSFIINGVPNVTSVYAEQIDNPANRIDASSFVILDTNTITANFNFGAANAGKTFLIFASGPNGTSRNLRTGQNPPGVPIGNEQGNQVTFTVNAPPPPPPNEINFGATSTSVAENAGNTTVTVTRSGDTSVPVTVDYATVDGTAVQKSDYIINLGKLRFAAGETSKAITLLIVDDVFVEGPQTFTISLSSPSGGFTAGPPITVTITDNDVVAPTSNPIDQIPFFVRQQYLDFLAREPDAVGFANWVATLTGCPNSGFGNTPGCDRVHVATSFFFSTEFQTRGYFIERFYEVAFGRRPTYIEFMTDLSTIGGFNSPAEEAANKVIYSDEFVLRPAFVATYGALSNTQYVDTLAATAGVTLSNRNALIADLNAATKTRAQVLREIVESTVVRDKFFNTAFVLMQYFGFLRRDPDTTGFNNWLTTLNSNGDFRHVTFGFIFSAEYRLRFGPHP